MKLKKLIGVMAVAGFVLPGAALATNGYFSHGYGLKAKGMGGAATATASDAMGGANNPASMVWVGNRMDVGIDWFSPIRSAKRTGAVTSDGTDPVVLDGSMNSGSENFLVPEFGLNYMLNQGMSLGLTVYGNGGMNSDYQPQTGAYTCSMRPLAAMTFAADNLLCGSGKLGVNLEQLIIAPTLAYKVNATNSVGVSPLLGYQRFSANGLSAFGSISSNPSNVSGTGHDSATGWGVRVGWQGKISDAVTLGAAYSTKIDMGKFERYKGLFAEGGDFDIPANYNLGVAWQATPAVMVAFDYQHIAYSDVKAIANSSRLAGCTPSLTGGTGATCLGGSNGLGFGWQDVDAWKLGVEWKYSKEMTLRAGFNHGDNPIRGQDVTFNILAPGVVQDHYTLGMTYALSAASELTVAYMHAAEKSVTGTSNNPYFTTNGTETIKMYQNSLGVAYGMKF